ncbi:MAG TPA: sulfatase, partial [Actinomycetota bacterium]
VSPGEHPMLARVKRLPRPMIAVSLACATLAVPFVASIGSASALSPAEASSRPNVLLIVTDDQRWDTLDAMPIVQAELMDRGVTFTNAFVSNPLCCPSRASILTGNYSHSTGVYRQAPPFGAFPSFRDASTLATWLHDEGYRTGMFGKYIDAYQHDALTGYVPPGWDRWVAFVHSSYYDYALTVDGTIEEHGSDPATDYSTTVLGDAAASFVRSAPSDQPLFVEFAPAAPHDPAIVEPGFERAFPDLAPWRPPSFDEVDVTDKPAYVQRFPRMTAGSMARLDAFRRRQFQTLQSVDAQVGRLLDALEETGRLQDTLIVFTSDNGLLWGEHRWLKKEVPYDEALRVPLVVRYDAANIEARTDEHLALNIDIAPTIASLAGVEHPATDGSNLGPLLADPAAPWRSDFLIEHMRGSNPVPTYCGVRTETQKLVRYETGEREFYDLSSDPGELDNIASDPERADTLARLEQRLDELCVPAPPGMDEGMTGEAAVLLVGASGVIGLVGFRSARRRRRHPR